MTRQRSSPETTFEGRTWANVQGSWRQLHGNYPETGVSVEWHDIKPAEELAWSESFHPDSLEICLNLSGTAQFRIGKQEIQINSRSIAVYSQHEELQAIRERRKTHRFLTVELSRDFLNGKVGAEPGVLRTGIHEFLSAGKQRKPVVESWTMSTSEQEAFAAWATPDIARPAQPLWYEAKVLDLLAKVVFKPVTEPEMFCARQKRLGRERMERVMEILKGRLHEPPSLEELGREVGCSPFYLSRTFSGYSGQTIPQYIRQLRMERAAELLREGRMNVTEVAFEVGYSSLGHFSKSFCEVIGVCPSLYPAASALIREPSAIRR